MCCKVCSHIFSTHEDVLLSFIKSEALKKDSYDLLWTILWLWLQECTVENTSALKLSKMSLKRVCACSFQLQCCFNHWVKDASFFWSSWQHNLNAFFWYFKSEWVLSSNVTLFTSSYSMKVFTDILFVVMINERQGTWSISRYN